MSVTVYVPRPGSHLRHTILPASGIVGTPWPEPHAVRTLIDYEGNRYGASNIVTFEDKVYHAADRQAQRYPTMARMVVDPAELIEVGEYDLAQRRLIVTNQADLDAWLTEQPKEQT